MTEKILQTKKNGMAVLLLVLVGYVCGIAAAAAAGMAGVPGLEGVPGHGGATSCWASPLRTWRWPGFYCAG